MARQLAVTMVVVAGFPQALADAYLRFHTEAITYNALATGLGGPRKQSLSTPQGCP